MSEKDIVWSDSIFVMESKYRTRILEEYRELALPSIEVLDIEDEYEFMDEELVELLTKKINDTLEFVYGI